MIVQGKLIDGQGTHELWFETHNNVVVEVGADEPPSKPDATGWILPSPVNAHSHIGDAFLAGKAPEGSVRQLVGPGGWKHQQLANADDETIVAGMESWSASAAAIGTDTVIDFREGGVGGMKILQKANPQVKVQAYGRPKKYNFDAKEAEQLLDMCHGIGLSGIRDFHKNRERRYWAEMCEDASMPFAIHVSEDRHDDMEQVLELSPHFVVHMCHGTKRDFATLAEENIPVVVCPRSNAQFGQPTPYQKMMDFGVTVAVGTDNAMLQDGNLLAELTHLRGSEEDRLRLLVNGRKIGGLNMSPIIAKGQSLQHIVLPYGVLETPSTKPSIGV